MGYESSVLRRATQRLEAAKKSRAEAQERRRERIRQKCIELYRRGEILA